MNRPLSRGQIRRAAALAFTRRSRTAAAGLREPEGMETPLSAAEVAFGIEQGLIRAQPVRAPVRAEGGVL